MICPEDRALIADITRKVVEERAPAAYQHRCVRRGGGVIYLRSRASVTQIKGVRGSVLLSVIDDVTEAVRSEQQLKRSAEQLRFLNETARDLLTQTKADRGIEEVLRRVRAYFDADRAYVIELDGEREVSNNTYEVCGEGVCSEKENLQGLPYSAHSFWFETLGSGDYISISEVSALGAERAEEKRILQAQGIGSLIAVPLQREGRLIGFLGVDDPRQQHSHVDQLRAIGDYLAAMLYRRDLNAKIASDNAALISLMKDTPGGFVRLRQRADGVIVPVYANDGFCRMVGMNRQELREIYNKNVINGVYPKDRGIVEAAVKEMLAGGEARSDKFRLRDGTGGYFWVRVFGRMSKNEAGEILFNVYYTDLSEREKKEQSLQDMLPAALAAMMEASSELIFVKDKNFKYVFCSQAFAKMSGLKSEKEVAGKTDYELFDRALADEYRQDDERVFESGEPLVDHIERLPIKDGVVHYVSTSKYLLRDSFGNVIGLYGTGWDVTQARMTGEELARERFYQKAMDTTSPVCNVIYTLGDGKLLHVGGALLAELGYSKEEYQAFHENYLRGLVLEEDYGTAFHCERAEAVENPRRIVEQEFRVLKKDGGVAWLYQRGTLTELDGTRVYVIVFVDITHRKESEERLRVSEEEMNLAILQMGKTICIYDPQTHTLTGPEQFAKGLGMPSVIQNIPERALTRGWISPATAGEYRALYDDILRGERTGVREYQVRNARGEWRFERAAFATIFGLDGKPVKTVIAVEDTTGLHEKERALKESERSLQRRAETDGMTGLYNKTALEELCKRRIAALPKGAVCALLVADLDDLKAINDTFGHDHGDEVIRRFGETLRSEFRQTDLVGRVGGDEFAVFLEGSVNEERLRSVLASFLRRLAALRFEGCPGLRLSGSVGLVISEDEQTSYGALFKKADLALYHVKRNGKADFALYTPQMEREFYEYKGHEAAALWQGKPFDDAELEKLLCAMAALYPLVISANLTQNSYHMMEYGNYTTAACSQAGLFDELIPEAAKTYHPEDREGFIDAFSRSSLLAAHAGGERVVSFNGRQLFGDGIYRYVHIDTVFLESAPGEDVRVITFAREASFTSQQPAGADGVLRVSLREAAEILFKLRLIFDIVRLADLSSMKPWTIDDDGHLAQGEKSCFTVWNRDRRCANCISRRALEHKTRLMKYECVGDEVYHIVSKYIEIDAKPYVLEIVSNVTGQFTRSALDKERIIGAIAEFNRLEESEH